MPYWKTTGSTLLAMWINRDQNNLKIYEVNPMQIVHGVIDDNVHVQNSLRLISVFEDAKKDFEFMLYPGGRHSYRRWPGNKELHFQNLKTKFIYRHLLEKPVPKELLK
jgi:dipeptidyl-peptidase-4